ncbi:hypothetical protein RN22_05355 [Grimontia sp. AD028]|uniref:hypothetical protein n=1 Tax=Grimontia sp. AD028 TaxID=1581149 RepID=UPI00061B368C|nr:hypothetical protein [Grimontia sp. AD028]KKD61551.1 hypothetical protein RN22_05355 [Grimontia sp. AD028]
MNFKTSVLAASVALILAGCGSDDSAPITGGGSTGGTSTELAKKPTIAVPESGRFIDAQVEGLYYVQGDLANDEGHLTDETGAYDILEGSPRVKFVLGNQYGGLVLGSVSGRDISTPYEVLGTQDRVISLVRLLLTINENADDTLIRIPTEIQDAAEDSNLIEALMAIELDRLEETVEPLLIALQMTINELVTEETAKEHLKNSLAGLERGSDTILTHWAKGSNWTFVQRSATQRIVQPNTNAYDNQLVIHADRSFGNNVFEKTNAPASSIFTLQSDKFIERAGSNDGSISSDYALTYLNCIANDGEFSWVEENGNELPACNGDTDYPKPEWDDVLYHYDYELVDPESTITEDIAHSWDGVAEMGNMYECMANANCSEKALTRYQELTRDDSDAQDGSAMQKETLVGSYDPITDVYTETRTKEYLNGNHLGRAVESISFTYPVEKPGVDRYVDFIGTWEATALNPVCPEMVAKATFTFTEVGLSMSGEELSTNQDGCYISQYEEDVYSYAELASIDYWWFGTNEAGASKATLDQLNSTIRWNDREADDVEDNFKINRFSYIPAGKNWDQGLFYRFTLDDNGNKIATETLRKIAN